MNVQPLPDKEQSCDVANALSAASLFTRAKKVGGSRLIQPTPVPALRNAQSSSRSDTCSTIRTFAQTISPFGKNLRELQRDLLLRRIPDNVGISYAFPSAKLARKALGPEVR